MTIMWLLSRITINNNGSTTESVKKDKAATSTGTKINYRQKWLNLSEVKRRNGYNIIFVIIIVQYAYYLSW